MIGIFDSGLGGLTVTRSFLEKFPEYNIVYLGDTARLPYGNRSAQAVYEFTRQGVDFLFNKGCEIIVVACNTASAEALKKIQQEYLPKKYPGKKVLGVIRPLSEKASEMTKNKRIGVIGTRGTILSSTYEKELKHINPSIKVYQVAASLLVPLIEEGWIKKPETRKILRYYLRDIKKYNVDTLILGCTHYPFLFDAIQNIMGKRCTVIDSGSAISDSFENYLIRHPDIEKKLKKQSQYRFFVTDLTENFSIMARKWMNKKIELSEISL